MKIYMCADHRGFELKEHLSSWLTSQGHDVIDCGNNKLEPLDDFVDFTFNAAKRLQADLQNDPKSSSLAVGVCGSGIGVGMAANRLKGVRCGLSYSVAHVKHGRENDHTNMLSLAADTLAPEEAEQIVEAFLTTSPNMEEKYVRRAAKLDQV